MRHPIFFTPSWSNSASVRSWIWSTVICSSSNILLNWINSLVLSDLSNLAKNTSREGIDCVGKDDGGLEKLLPLECCAKESIWGVIANKIGVVLGFEFRIMDVDGIWIELSLALLDREKIGKSGGWILSVVPWI